MTAVMVALRPRPLEDEAAQQLPRVLDDIDTIEVVSDMGDFGEHMMCACSSSEDQPY